MIKKSEFDEMQKFLQAHPLHPVVACACATEDGMSYCEKREGQWEALVPATKEMVTCLKCIDVLWPEGNK